MKIIPQISSLLYKSFSSTLLPFYSVFFLSLRKQQRAVDLIDRVVITAIILVAAATVSVNIHGQWYTYLIDLT